MVSFHEVADFKFISGENKLISSVIYNEFSDLLPEPILDVGSGLGDIPTDALYNKKTILTDINHIGATKLSPNHFFIQKDFFDLTINDFNEPLQTLMISHTLQYLDENVLRLRAKIEQLTPKKILLVTNDNNHDMGKIIKFFALHFPYANPELPNIDFLPTNFILEKSASLVANLTCSTFDSLSTQVAYLMDISLNQQHHLKLSIFLKELLESPSLTIQQSIRLFTKKINQTFK